MTQGQKVPLFYFFMQKHSIPCGTSIDRRCSTASFWTLFLWLFHTTRMRCLALAAVSHESSLLPNCACLGPDGVHHLKRQPLAERTCEIFRKYSAPTSCSEDNRIHPVTSHWIGSVLALRSSTRAAAAPSKEISADIPKSRYQIRRRPCKHCACKEGMLPFTHHGSPLRGRADTTRRFTRSAIIIMVNILQPATCIHSISQMSDGIAPTPS